MTTVAAQAIVNKARTILQDTGIRWPDAEMLGWVNDGQREIATIRPEVSRTTVTLALANGPRQDLATLYPSATRLVEVLSNTAGRAVRMTDRALLDAQRPGWLVDAASAVIKNYTFDPRSPKVFYVYPPAAAASLEAVVDATPADLASLADNLAIDSIYENPMVDYVLFRAYSKDAEFAGGSERAAAARASFENTMGLKAQADAAATPKAGA